MRQTRPFLFLTLGLLLLFSGILPTYAAPALQSTPRPSPTYKVCHLCGEDVAAATIPQPDGVVHAVLFWMNGCGHCEYVRTQTLPPLQARYGPAFDLLQVEVVTRADIDLLYAIAGRFGVEQTRVGVPFLIIGEHVLVGSRQIPEELPGLIETYLEAGGVPQPIIPELESFSSMTAAAGAEEAVAPLSPTPATVEVRPAPTEPLPLVQEPARANGFGLAIAVMIFMALVLVYTPIALVMGKSFSLPAWVDWLIPVLIVIGIGIAAYLSYVETKMVEAACGPIGDCNTVQTSRYSKLFGILPVGLLGLAGYIGLLAAWLVRRFIPRLEKPAVLAFWGMAFFAVSFSLYLTYLEPFVIRAVCIWCLSSAVIVTLLLLLGTLPAVRLFAMPED
ncbi:MAG: vitamin K epoxide reductase family protein [Candidatus Villigracilaceae bacterium]